MKSILSSLVSLCLLTAFASRYYAQDALLLPAPPEIRVVEQPDSPVRLSIAGVRRMDGQVRFIGLNVENLSGKGLVAVATQGMEKDERDGQISWGTPLRSGHSAHFSSMSPRSIEGERRIYVDAVLFEDGSVWGPNNSGSADFFKGVHAGRLRLIEDATEQLRKHDDEAVKNFVTGSILPEHARAEKMTKYDEGFRRGYAEGIYGMRQDLELRKGDVRSVADRLEVLKSQMGMGSRGVKRIGRTSTVNEVLRIEKVEVRGRAVPFNEAFGTGDDWMRGVVVTLKNVSRERIVSFTLNVQFPETTATGNMMMYTSPYGRHPGLPAEVKIAERPTIDPDATVAISISGEEFVRLDRFLNERQPLSELSRAELSIGMVHFEDGTAWSAGNLMKRDPNDPTRWMPVEKPQHP